MKMLGKKIKNLLVERKGIKGQSFLHVRAIKRKKGNKIWGIN